MTSSIIGHDGRKYFPCIFTLFLFILSMNLLGLFTLFGPTGQLAVTATLALMTILVVIGVGFAKNGLGFFKLFVPSGVPFALLILLVPIEIISFFTRPLSHSLRLFGNILGGHIVLKVFAGMVVALIATGAWAPLGVLPLAMTVALTPLELLVGVLQAFVFAVLTCVYLQDAIHPGH